MEYEVIKPPSTAPENNESLVGKGVRNIARLGSRAVETVAGLPGDITNTVLGLAKGGIEKLSGVKQEHPGTGPFPSSSDIRSGIESTVGKVLPEGYLKPKGSIESGLDTLVSDIASLSIGGVPLKSATKIAGIGNVAGWLSKPILGETGGEAVKLGTMVLYPLRKELKPYIENLYTSARNALPQGALTNSAKTESYINDALKYSSSGISEAVPHKKELAEIARSLDSKVQMGKIPVEQLWEATKDINYILSNEKIDKSLAFHLRKLNKGLMESIHDYGNKEFSKYLMDANELYSGLHKATDAHKFINKHLPPKISALSTALFGLKSIAKRQIARGVLGRGSDIYQALAGLVGSPAARRYYTQAISAAAKKNGPLVAKSIANLDRELRDLPSSGEYEVVTPPS
jgi:hypothetical protein